MLPVILVLTWRHENVSSRDGIVTSKVPDFTVCLRNLHTDICCSGSIKNSNTLFMIITSAEMITSGLWDMFPSTISIRFCRSNSIKLKYHKWQGFSMQHYRCSTIWPTQQIKVINSLSSYLTMMFNCRHYDGQIRFWEPRHNSIDITHDMEEMQK